MDGKGKRAAGRFGFSKRGNNLSFSDSNQEDRSTQDFSRSACSTRFNSTKGSQAGIQEKMKYPKAPFRSQGSKGAVGSSSISFSSSDGFRKSHEEHQNRVFLRESYFEESSSTLGKLQGTIFSDTEEFIDESDSSSRQEEYEDSEYGSAMSSIHTFQEDSEELESAIQQGIATREASNNFTASSSRPHKQHNRQFGSCKQGSPGSSIRQSLVSRSTSYVTKPVSHGTIADRVVGTPRYGLKNLGCTSVSDVVPSDSSSSESSQTRRFGSVRKIYNNAESSSARRRGMSESTSGGSSRSLGTGLSGLLSDRPFPQQTSRRVRNQPAYRDSGVSVRTRWVPSEQTRPRLPELEADNSLTSTESTVISRSVISRTPHIQFNIPESVPGSSSRSFLTELPPVFHDTFGRSSTNSWNARSRLISRPEDSTSQIFRVPAADTARYRRFRTEGITEVLLALERLEQDEELTYEQLLVLKTNFFFGGLSLEDQHRDMRMDIDNMSYEELLALGEKMGTVSTALPEEAFTKCLTRSIYTPVGRISGIACSGDDDIKCSICQEEYNIGDEMNKLACEHRYHVDCIHQWLKQKNWCPICKAPVCPS